MYKWIKWENGTIACYLQHCSSFDRWPYFAIIDLTVAYQIVCSQFCLAVRIYFQGFAPAASWFTKFLLPISDNGQCANYLEKDGQFSIKI